MALDHLANTCGARVIAADPALHGEAWETLQRALEKLFAQFIREDRVVDWGCELTAAGSAVVIAWDDSAREKLSGCSHDKLTRLLLAHEERWACRLINAPPIVVVIDGKGCCVDRSALRALLISGQAHASTPMVDLRTGDLESWRRQGLRTLQDSSLWPSVAPARAD